MQATLGERRYQLVLGGKLAIQAADSGARCLRDRGHRRLEAVAGEDTLGGEQQAVALGVRIQR